MAPFLLTAIVGPHITEETYLIWLLGNAWWLAILFLAGFSVYTHPEMWN